MSSNSWTNRREAPPAGSGSRDERRPDERLQAGSFGVQDRGARVMDKSGASVLLVDDDATKRLALKAALAPLSLPIVETDSGEGALRILMDQDFAVILLDVRMPDIDGFETAALIRRRRESEMTPIIFITAFAGDEIGAKSRYVSGAVDFIFAPFHPDELRAKVSVFVNLYLQAASLAADAQEVQGSADQLQLLTDAAPIGIFRTDADGKFVYTNPRWTEISGVSWQDALGRDWASIMGSANSPGVAFDDSSLTSGVKPAGQRFELTLPDATSRVVLSTSEPIYAPDGAVFGWVGTLADVTAATRAEQERSRFTSLVQNARDVIVVLDVEGRVSYVSPGVREVTGFLPEELIGTMGIDSVHPDDVEMAASHLTEIVQFPESMKTVEVRTETKLGGWIWVEVRAINRVDDPAINGLVINYHDITERRAAAERMAASEKLLADGQALSHLGSFTWDMRTDELIWSDEQYRLLGFEPGSVAATFETLLDRLHPDDRAEFSRLAQTSVETGAPFEQEHRIVLPDGTSRWIHARGEVEMEDGIPVLMMGMSRDITSQKDAEAERILLLEAQRASADQLRLLLDSTGEGIYGIDAQGICTFMNTAGALLLGGVAEDFLGTRVHDLVHHTHPDGSAYPVSECPIYHGLAKGETTSTFGELFWRLDGTPFPVDYSSHPIGGHGSTDGAVITFQDVTQRLAMEKELRQSEKLFRGAFDAAQMGIALVAPDGVTYVDVNAALCEMLGYAKEELLPLDWREITHPDDLADSIEADEELRKGDVEVRYLSKRYVRKDGGFISAETCHSIVRGPDGEIVVWVTQVNDVTERERAAQENEKLENELMQSQKMEAVGQLAGGIAHDFNNILSVILNYAQFAGAGLEPGDERLADIQEISKAGDKAAELVHQLLAFSRKEIIEARVIDLNEVVTGVYQILSRSLGEDIDLDFKGGDDVKPVMADPGRIEQVLLNLAVNARDAMPDGGVLKITTGAVEFEEGGASKFHPGAYSFIKVSDSGSGMDEETVERIFEPFFTTKPRGEGTGMGLSSAYGIIEQAGGILSVESEPGLGTTFTVYLPVAGSAVSPVMPPIHEVRSAGGSETIVVVEDEGAVRELVIRVLRQQGYKVVPFDSGAEALGYCREHPDSIDLLLTDVVMPKMSGRELSDQASAICVGLKTLFMSGYTDELVAQRGVLASSEYLINKPFSPEALLTSVRSMLDMEIAV